MWIQAVEEHEQAVMDNRLLRVSAYVENCTRTVRLMTISNYES